MERSDMNTFSQLLHTLLGLGTEPRELTFLQVARTRGNCFHRGSNHGETGK